MTPGFSLAAILVDAGRLWRGERELLVPLAGLFYFLPALTLLLLLPEPVAVADPSGSAQADALVAYAGANAGAIISANAMNLFGACAILVLMLSPARPTIREALVRAAALLPWFVVSVVTMWAVLFVAGFLILPAMYLLGRFFLVTAALAAEGGKGPVEAIARSLALTRGRGWMLFTLVAGVFLSGYVVVVLAGSLDAASDAVKMGSPVTRIIFNGIAALATTASSLMILLMKVAVYRRVASNGI